MWNWIKAHKWGLAGGCAAAIAGLVISGVLLARASYVHEMVRKKAVQVASDAIEGRVEIGNINGDLLSQVTVEDVEVYDSGGGFVASVPGVTVDYSIAALVGAPLQIESISVRDPFILIHRSKDGTLNVNTLAKPSDQPKGEPTPMSLPKLSLEGARLVYIDEAGIAKMAKAAPGRRFAETIQQNLASGWSPKAKKSIRRAERTYVAALADADIPPGRPPAVASIRDLGIDARVNQKSEGLEVSVQKLSGVIASGLQTEDVELDVAKTNLRNSPEHVAVELQEMAVSDTPVLNEVSANIELATPETQSDSFARRVEGARLDVGRATATPKVLATFRYPDLLRAKSTVGISAELEGRKLQYQVEYDCKNKGGSVVVDGSIEGLGASFRPTEKLEQSAKLEFGHLRPSKCLRMIPQPLDGNGTAQITTSGWPARKMGGRLALELSDSSFANYSLQSVEAKLEYSPEDLNLKSLLVDTSVGKLSGSLVGKPSGDLSGKLTVSRSSSMKLPPGVRNLGPVESSLKLDGQIDWEKLTSMEALEKLRVEGKLDFERIGTKSASIRSLQGQYSLGFEHGNKKRSSRLNWTLEATSSRLKSKQNRLNRLEISSSGDIAASLETLMNPGSAAGKVDGIRIREPIEAQLGLGGLRAAGASVKKVEAKTRVEDLEALSGNATLTLSELTYGDRELDKFALIAGFQNDGRFGLRTELAPEGVEAPIKVNFGGQTSFRDRRLTVDSAQFKWGQKTWQLGPNGELEVDPTRVRASKFQFEWKDQRVGLRGAYRFGGEASDVRLSVSNFDLSMLSGLPWVGVPPLKGRFSLLTHLGGTPSEPMLGGQLRLEGLEYAPHGPFDVSAAYRYENDTFRLSKWSVATPETKLVEGRLEIPVHLGGQSGFELLKDKPLSASVSTPEIELTDLYDLAPVLESYNVEGQFETGIEVGGSIERPNLDLMWRVDDLSASSRMGRRTVELSDISAAGDIEVGPPEAKKGRDTGFGGAQAPEGEAGPGAGAMVNGLSIDLDWGDTKLVDFDTAFEFEPRALVQTLQGADKPVRATYEFLEKQHLSVRGQVELPPLGKVPLDLARKANAKGDVGLQISGAGTFGNPDLKMEANLEGVSWGPIRDVSSHVDMVFRDWVLRLKKFDVHWSGKHFFTAAAQTDLTALADPTVDFHTISFQFDCELKPFEISRLSMIDYTLASVEGNLGGKFHVGGNLGDIDVSGRLGLYETRFGENRTGNIEATVDRSGDWLEGGLSVASQDEQILTVEGKVPMHFGLFDYLEGRYLREGRELSAIAKSDGIDLSKTIPPELVRDFVQDIEGKMVADLAVTGVPGQLEPSGSFALENGEFMFPEIGRKLENVNLDVGFEPGTVHLREFSFEDRLSKISAKGNVAIDNLTPKSFDLGVEMKDFNIAGLGTNMEAYVSSKLDIKGQLEKDTEKIDINIEKMHVHLPQQQSKALYPTTLSSDLVFDSESRSKKLYKKLTGLEASSTEPLKTEVHVKSTKKTWIHHQNGKIQLQIDLRVEMREGTTQIYGGIDSVSGDIEFVGKEFTVPAKGGIIEFTGASPPRPNLNIEARYMLERSIVAGIGEPTSGVPHIEIQVLGPSDSPRLELSSDPVMSDTEIIFVLVTGRPPGSADFGEESSAASRAVGAASGLFAGMIQQKLSGSVPVDVLRLQTGGGGLAKSRLQIGSYLTDDVFVSYYFQFGSVGDDRASTHVGEIEYRFAPRWKLETRYTDMGTGEVFVFWDIY